jgi:hypothetical protein
MASKEEKMFISMNLVKAFIDIGLPVAPGFYSALLFIDQHVGYCNLTIATDMKGELIWVADTGTIVGVGKERVNAVEDVLRQFLARRKRNGDSVAT